MSDVLISASHLKVIYNAGKDNEFLALDDVSVEIFKEEYTIFFGPSGCGKSTLLYTILGLQAPSAGDVVVQGKNSSTLTKAEKNATLSQFFGIVFQNFNLIYSLNVVDNVALPQMFIRKTVRKERRAKALELLKRFGIDAKANVLPGTLSGGQQQRVSICRALINNPQIILADEPVGNLDSESAEVVMHTLKEINQKDKKTIVLVTHDPNYLKFADRVYFFKYGKIDRMVVNKNANVEHQSLTKESDLAANLEKLARAHENLSVEELRAWSATNYLMEECSAAQIFRLEKAMESLLAGKTSEQEFYIFLHQPYSEGGVGLYRPTALKYTLRVSEFLKIITEYKEVLKGESSERRSLAVLRQLAKFILEPYHGSLSDTQEKLLVKLVLERVHGQIPSEEFVKIVSTPEKEHGVGLRVVAAQHLSDRLELVLVQNNK